MRFALPSLAFSAAIAMSACSPPLQTSNPSDEQQSPTAPAQTLPEPEAPLVPAPRPIKPEAPEPRPRNFHMADEWVGRWAGPEGLFLEVEPGEATNTVQLLLKDTLDSEAKYDGVLIEDGIQFERAGRVEVIRHGSGADTGFSALRSRTDCLIVRQGSEGYCKR